MNLLMVGSFGLAGVLSRFCVNLMAARLWPASSWPLATLMVNLSGSFAMGAALAAIMARGGATPLLMALTTGFLGGFTTFSAFSGELLLMVQRGALLPAAIYGLGSPLLGFAACAAGYGLLKSFLP